MKEKGKNKAKLVGTAITVLCFYFNFTHHLNFFGGIVHLHPLSYLKSLNVPFISMLTYVRVLM